MRGIWTKYSRDDGMTIVEVMVAAAILFFAITALLGLISQTLSTGMQAKQTTVLTNAVNSYIERVQAMPFDDVVVGTEDGQLSAVETMTVEGFVIEFRPTIHAGATSDLKSLSITATITWGSGRTETFTTNVVIRDKDAFLTQASEGPSVTWTTAQMPAEGEVVWSNLKESGGLLYLGFVAEAAGGRTITAVSIKSDTSWPLESYTGEIASWSIPEEEREQTYTLDYWNWNTAQLGIVDIEQPAVPVIPDGVRTIKVRVDDSAGGYTERTYTFLVDNNPPPMPTDLAQGLSSSGPVASWTTPLDGTTPPVSCTVGLSKMTLSGSLWTWPRTVTTGVTTNQIALEPFSRYVVDVTSVGVDPEGAREARVSTPTVTPKCFVTPPRASGTQTVAGNGSKRTYKVSLSVTTPQFAVSGTPTYVWYSSTSPSGPWTTQVATTATVTDLSYGGSALYYRCFVTVTPWGLEPDWSVPTSRTVASSVIGPTSSSTSTALPLAEQWLQ